MSTDHRYSAIHRAISVIPTHAVTSRMIDQVVDGAVKNLRDQDAALDFATIAHVLDTRENLSNRIRIFVSMMKEAERDILAKLDETGGDRVKFLEAAKSLGYHKPGYGPTWGRALDIVELEIRDGHLVVTCEEAEYAMGCHTGTLHETIMIPARYLNGGDPAINAREFALERAAQVSVKMVEMAVIDTKAAEDEAARQREKDRETFERLRPMFENEKTS